MRELIAAGVNPRAIREATGVCFLFNVLDRLADALDFTLPTEAEARAIGGLLFAFSFVPQMVLFIGQMLVNRDGALPVFVAYNIPNRDCGLYSAGGARGGDAYRRWIQAFAQGLNRRRAVVILEPDGLASSDCLPVRLRDERMVLLREAVQVLTAAGAAVYVDAGNANWRQPEEMARMLRNVGIDRAQGFALNVSNFHGLAPNLAYGERLSRLVGGKHFVIDTSRNGAGTANGNDWCNTQGQALAHVRSLQVERASALLGPL